MRSRLNLRRVARFACATLAMSLAAGLGAQAVITTPGGLEAVFLPDHGDGSSAQSRTSAKRARSV
jgi:hypothetical protein